MSDAPEQIRTEYELTLGDHLRAIVMESLGSRVASALAGSLVVMGIFLIVNDDWLGWLSVGLGLLAITGLYNAPVIWWAVHRRADLMLGRRQLVADGAGIRITGPTSNVELTWGTFRAVRVRRDGIVLDYGTGFALLIPTRSFTPAAVDAFRALARQAGKLDTSPRWTRTAVGLTVGIGLTVAAMLAVANMA